LRALTWRSTCSSSRVIIPMRSHTTLQSRHRKQALMGCCIPRTFLRCGLEECRMKRHTGSH
jgi:hypothetical protein